MDEADFFFTFLSFLLLLCATIKLFAIDRRLKKLEKNTPVLPPESACREKTATSPSQAFGNRLKVPAAPAAPAEKEISSDSGRVSAWFRRFWHWFYVGNQKEGVSAEYAAATTWLIRCGVIILLAAAGFFLKYSIENNLVNPTVRVISTFAAGAAMFAAGLRGVNRKYHQVFCGIMSVGTVTLYMGTFAGYKLYALIPAAAAFGIMTVVTAAAMTAAVKLRLLPVAVTGCAGAYLAPVVLSSSSGNVPAFAAYTAVVSAGILIASRKHLWRVLEVMAFIMSFVLIASACGTRPDKINTVCIGCLLANFLVFSLIPVIRRKHDSIGVVELLLPMAGTAAALLQGLWMIHECFGETRSHTAAAVFALIISAVTLAEGIWLKLKRSDTAKVVPAFFSAAVIALSVAIPCALREPGSIASGFSILALMLTISAVFGRENILFYISILMYAFLAPFAAEFRSEAGTRFFFGGVYTLSLLGGGYFLKKRAAGKLANDMKNILLTAGGTAFFLYTSVEVFQFLKNCKLLHDFRHGGLSVWWAILAVSWLICGVRKDHKYLRAAGLLLFAATTVKAAVIDISGLNTLWKVAALLLLGVIFLGGAAVYIRFRKNFTGNLSA